MLCRNIFLALHRRVKHRLHKIKEYYNRLMYMPMLGIIPIKVSVSPIFKVTPKVFASAIITGSFFFPLTYNFTSNPILFHSRSKY